jgi:hypothetical protein
MFALVLPQVVTKPGLEAWLFERIEFHSVPANREALFEVLKTHINGGQPVEPQALVTTTWVETIDDPEPAGEWEGGPGA